MGAQNRYGYISPLGSAGGIVDLAPYAIDTFINSEETGKMKFGLGVVVGDKPGTNIALPVEGATAEKFCGVTVNNRTTEYDLDGKLRVIKGAGIGVMKYGRVYGMLSKDIKPAYGDKLYLITKGDETGYFTNVADGNVAVKGRFLGKNDISLGIAMIELYNQAQA